MKVLHTAIWSLVVVWQIWVAVGSVQHGLQVFWSGEVPERRAKPIPYGWVYLVVGCVFAGLSVLGALATFMFALGSPWS